MPSVYLHPARSTKQDSPAARGEVPSVALPTGADLDREAARQTVQAVGSATAGSSVRGSSRLLTADCLIQSQTDYALYGGLALAAYGRPRETKDADVAVLEPDVNALAARLDRAGAMATVTFEGVAFGGLWLSRITVIGEGATSGPNMIDLVRPKSTRLAAAVIQRAIEAPLRGQTIRVVSPEDFIVLKVLTTRDSDLEDAATVLKRDPDFVDRATIEQEVAALASELPEHDVAARWSRARALASRADGLA